MARLYISKLKSEVKTLVQRCSHLDTQQAECSKKLDETEKDLSGSKLVIQQVQAMVSLYLNTFKSYPWLAIKSQAIFTLVGVVLVQWLARLAKDWEVPSSSPGYQIKNYTLNFKLYFALLNSETIVRRKEWLMNKLLGLMIW